MGNSKVGCCSDHQPIDVGPTEVGSITCEQYAFRQPGLDRQIWIQLGDFPLPKKLVITTQLTRRGRFTSQS